MNRKILSLDGGGIKGAYAASFLATLEKSVPNIVSHFDLIAGTSTGGIIALGLATGKSCAEILDFYVKRGPEVFYKRSTLERFKGLFRAKYRSDSLRQVLQEFFGKRLLGDSSTRLVIPAFNNVAGGNVYVFKTAHHPRLEVDLHRQMVDVALATAAAPTIFQAHKIGGVASLIDGGVWANNPAGMAAVEAVCLLGWERTSLRMLSLGCTEPLYECPSSTSRLALARSVSTLFCQGQSLGSLGTAKLLSGHTEQEPHLFRYSTIVKDGTYKIDSVQAIEELVNAGAVAARAALPAMKQVFLNAPVEPFVPYHST